MTCMFFSADEGKTTDRVLMTHTLQTVIKLSVVANGGESFRVHCFACWTSPEVILFNGSFHLLQDPAYRVWSLASHTKHSISARRYLVLVTIFFTGTRGKTGIWWSSKGSGLFCYHPDSALHWLDLQCMPEKSMGPWLRFQVDLVLSDMAATSEP